MPKSAQSEKLNNHLLEFISLSFCLVVLSLSMFNLSRYFTNQKPVVKVLGTQIDLEKEEEKWKDIVIQTPTYRDGWIELAKLQKEMGKNDFEDIYLQRAAEIDPNFIQP